jgi:Na+-driven multidrug efflux pump
VLTGSIGLIAALAPDLWLGLFSQDPDVLAAGRTYLRIVGPAYGFFGLGLSLYFASQGLGRLGWPLIAGFARLSVATVGGWIVVHRLGGELPGLFAIITLALIVFGTTVAVALWRKSS